MKQSLFRLFITSGKPTTYPWMACQKHMSFNIASKEAGISSFSLICFIFSPAPFVWFEPSEDCWHKETRRRTQNSQEVHLRAKCCLTVSSWRTSTGAIREHLSRERTHFVPPRPPCQSNLLRHVADISPADIIAPEDRLLRLSAFCVRAWGKAAMTPRLFLVKYTESRLGVVLLRSSDGRTGHRRRQGAPGQRRPRSLTPALRLLHQWESLTRFLSGS